jgi:hypothetical protein
MQLCIPKELEQMERAHWGVKTAACHLWDTPDDSSVFYKELIKNNGHYVNAEITLYDDDDTGTDEFKIVVSGLDFGSRIFFTWVDLVEMGKVLATTLLISSISQQYFI